VVKVGRKGSRSKEEESIVENRRQKGNRKK
jgi:hypothetical protein